MEPSSHWAEMCEMSVKSCRGNRQTVKSLSPKASRSHHSRYAERWGKCVAANCASVCVCVWRVSLGWQMSDLSAPPPLWDHLLDWGHLEGGPSLSGVILQGSDPACWPTIDDHMITQNFLHVWVLLSVCLLYSPLFLLSPFSWIFGVTMKKTEINTTIIQIFSSNFLAAKSIVAS